MLNIHGDFELSLTDNILQIDLKGSFNEAGALALTTEIKDKLRSIQDKPIYIIVNDKELVGITPEGFAILEKYNQWLNSKNLVAKAMVVNSSIIQDIDKRYIPSSTKQNIKFFTDLESARSWLKLQQN